jgi:hypothetical protein
MSAIGLLREIELVPPVVQFKSYPRSAGETLTEGAAESFRGSTARRYQANSQIQISTRALA